MDCISTKDLAVGLAERAGEKRRRLRLQPFCDLCRAVAKEDQPSAARKARRCSWITPVAIIPIHDSEIGEAHPAAVLAIVLGAERLEPPTQRRSADKRFLNLDSREKACPAYGENHNVLDGLNWPVFR